MNPKVVDFLKKQTVQEPIEVDTSWLAVGHVDEFIGIVPGGPKGFKLLLGSPKRAYAILAANKAANGASKLLTGRKYPDVDAAGFLVGWKDVEVSISGFLTTGIPNLGLAAAALKSFNDDKQARIDATRKDLKDELGLDESDIIDVPVIFRPVEDAPTEAEALTGDTVNMLVVNKHCIPPKPFGPVVGGKDLFEEELKNALTPLGLTVNFLDDWYEYHVNMGEVHCGTNTLRKQPSAKWWEFAP
jgi:protein-arginine deiminase